MPFTPQEIDSLPEYKRAKAVAELTIDQVAQTLRKCPQDISKEVFAMIAERLPEVLEHPGMNQNAIVRTMIMQGDYEGASEGIITMIREGLVPSEKITKNGIFLLSGALLDEHHYPRRSSTETINDILRNDLAFIAQFTAEDILATDTFFAQYTLEEGSPEDIFIMIFKSSTMAKICNLFGQKRLATELENNVMSYIDFSPDGMMLVAADLLAQNKLKEAYPLIKKLQLLLESNRLTPKEKKETCKFISDYFEELAQYPDQIPY